jgi:GntR family transcriptional regulator / MocR family aminotransferase
VADLLPALLRLSRAGDDTLTQQLTDQLRNLITSGRLAPGQRLLSSRLLAEALKISRNTVSSVIEQLATEGYITLSKGRRPVVSQGAALDTSRLSSANRKQRQGARLSTWARSLHGDNWPPVHAGPARPFQPGLADEREFPHDEWGRYLRRAAGRLALPRGKSINYPELQVTLLRHLIEHRGIRASADQLLIVPSAQSGMALIAAVTLDHGDLAWVESPGYGGAVAALRAAGAVIRGIPIDKAGMAIDRGRDAPRIIFVTPSHQYPTGRLMPIARRLELVSFAASVGASIVEDDYDSEFHYEGRPLAAMQGILPSGANYYVGTFSKATYPDLRVGYIVVPRELVETFERAQRHLGLFAGITIQRALAAFIGDGVFIAHVRRMNRLYKLRRDCMLHALSTKAGNRLTADAPAGGMQIMVRYDGRAGDQRLSQELFKAGVVSRPLSGMLYHKSNEQGLLLGFAAWNEKEIEQAAGILGRIVR